MANIKELKDLEVEVEEEEEEDDELGQDSERDEGMQKTAEKQDPSYNPSDSEGDSQDDDDDVVEGEKLDTGDVEIINTDGTITTARAYLTEAQQEDEEKRILDEVKKDTQFQNITNRRRVRMIEVIKEGKAAAELKDQPIIDFGDTAKLEKKTKYSTIECENGTLVRVLAPDSARGWRLREMSQDELKEALEANGGRPLPCRCINCSKREKNSLYIKPGEKRGGRKEKNVWTERYGDGHRL